MGGPVLRDPAKSCRARVEIESRTGFWQPGAASVRLLRSRPARDCRSNNHFRRSGFATPAFDDCGLRDHLLVRPGRPRYPVFIHRAADFLHASFKPRLATPPLRFANCATINQAGWRICTSKLPIMLGTQTIARTRRAIAGGGRRLTGPIGHHALLSGRQRERSLGGRCWRPSAHSPSRPDTSRSRWAECADPYRRQYRR